MVRSVKSRTQPIVADVHSVAPASVEVELERQDAELNKPVRVVPPYITSRHTLTGNSPGPVWGDVVGPIPDYVYKLAFRVVEQSAPAVRFELRAAMRPDVDWENDSMALDSAGMWLKRPSAGGGEAIIPSAVGDKNATKHTRRLPATGVASPRWPQYVRPVCFPMTRKGFSAIVEVELQRGAE